MSTKRVAICDDHEIVREALRFQIDAQDDLQVVGEAADGKEAVAVVVSQKPDLAIIDVELPDSDGITLISRLLGERPELRIMVFSAHEEPGLVSLAAEQGAHGFVGKSESTSAIVPAARVVLSGELWFPRLPPPDAERSGNGDDELRRLRSLTPREREVLKLFAEGMRADGVAAKAGIRRATVYTHVRNAIHKLDVDSRTQAVSIATRYSFLEHDAGTHDAGTHDAGTHDAGTARQE